MIFAAFAMSCNEISLTSRVEIRDKVLSIIFCLVSVFSVAANVCLRSCAKTKRFSVHIIISQCTRACQMRINLIIYRSCRSRARNCPLNIDFAAFCGIIEGVEGGYENYSVSERIYKKRRQVPCVGMRKKWVFSYCRDALRSR